MQKKHSIFTNLFFGGEFAKIMRFKDLAESKAEANKLFSGLSVGGQIEMPIADSPWGSYFGMFRDKYGIEWMVDFDPNNKEKI
jgi:uncharacterized glyoxalase superfamily protein PhnB